MKIVQLSLFENLGSRDSFTYNEVTLEKMLIDLREYINKGVINTSDTYFNIAYYREPKITKEKDVYQLRFAQSSDSERFLSAYETNKNIKPLELLGVGVAKGALRSIERYINDNPRATTREILENFKIFDYPTYSWTHAQSSSLEEINCVKELIIRWAKLKEEMQMDLSEGKFTFMRTNKRTKLEDQTKIIPQCFDGLCLEQNIMKILASVAE